MADTEKRSDNGGRDPNTGQFRHGNKGGGRRPMPPELREMLEAATPKAAETLIAALDAERSIVVGMGGDAYVEKVPDYDMRVKAANAIFDRVYGKPAQALTDGEGGPIQVGVVILPIEDDSR